MKDIVHVITPDDVEAQYKLLHAFLQIRRQNNQPKPGRKICTSTRPEDFATEVYSNGFLHS